MQILTLFLSINNKWRWHLKSNNGIIATSRFDDYKDWNKCFNSWLLTRNDLPIWKKEQSYLINVTIQKIQRE